MQCELNTAASQNDDGQIKGMDEPLVVNSYAEWHPLEEVIVGRIGPTEFDTTDTSFRLFFWENLIGSDLLEIDNYRVPEHIVEECREDLDQLEATLVAHGVTVRRPASLSLSSHTLVSPYGWTAAASHAYNVRDQVLVYGNTLIETPCLVRSRLYENRQLYPIFYEYLNKGARWVAAPQPSLADHSFDVSIVQAEAPSLLLPGKIMAANALEMMLDAAQCLRFGRDIIANIGNANHALAVKWMRALLPEVRIHEVRLVDSHLDATLLPLRPGVLFVDRRKVERHDLPEGLREWKWIDVGEEELQDNYLYARRTLASVALAMNVLSLDEQRVLVNESATPIIRLLEKNDFTPVPVRFRHGRTFGGGIHCCTLDVRRRGIAESYF